MFTAILSFIKGKVFSQAGSFLLPIIGLLAVFLIWNSDLILTKFGFETTTNLKAEVTRLTSDLEKVKEANVTLTNTIKQMEADAVIATDVAVDVVETKAETKGTVTDIIEQRKKKAQALLNACSCEQPSTSDKVTVVSSTETSAVKATPKPVIKQPAITPEIVDRLSEDNIDAINAAYSTFFGGNTQ